MLEGVTAGYTARLLEIRRFLAFIEDAAKPLAPYGRPEILTAKGLYFVELYGVFEYTVVRTLASAIKALNDAQVPIESCQPVLLGLGLDAECKSMSTAGPQTHWEKRCHLFGRTRIPAPLQIPDNVLPVGLGTIKFRHLSEWSGLRRVRHTLHAPLEGRVNHPRKQKCPHRNFLDNRIRGGASLCPLR